MKTVPTLAVVVAGVAAMTLAGFQAAAQTEARTLTIALTGAAEGPGLGDPDGSGTAELRIDPAKGELCYVLKVADIAPARLSHIHKSPAGEAGGPIVADLEPPSDGSSEGCTAITRELAEEILWNPEGYYVNVHNAEHP